MTFRLDEATECLSRTPKTLTALLAALPEPWLSCDEGEGTWSPRDVVAHLADLEATEWVGRARIILEHGTNQPFDPVDRLRFRKRFEADTTLELLDIFAERRRQSLSDLEALDVETKLSRVGRHPNFGHVTLEQLLATWVVHDLSHIAQIVRVMAKRYGEAGGPWHAFLPVLSSTGSASD